MGSHPIPSCIHRNVEVLQERLQKSNIIYRGAKWGWLLRYWISHSM